MSRADYPAFILMPRFDAQWRLLGLDDADLAALERVLAKNPEAGDVVPGTGGARKLRVRLPGRGKSGGLRVIYANFRSHHTLLLAEAYGKSRQTTLSAAEKAGLAALIAAISATLSPTD